jgi:transposase-like protein
MQSIRKTYTAEFKAKVVKEILKEEKTLSQIDTQKSGS